MKRKFLTVLFLYLLPFAAWSQKPFSSKIVDAKTGEPLPYAQVYATNGKGCLSNGEGEFVLQDCTADSIRVSFVGYATQWFPTGKPLAEIRLQPCARQLREVTVTPKSMRSILTALARRLEKDYKRGKEAEGWYFCRMMEQSDKVNDLMDAIVKARSTVNLRKAEVLTGKHRSLSTKDGKPSLAQMNLHRILEVGHIIRDADFWTDIIAPLDRILFMNQLRYYDYDYDILSQENGDAMYKITMVRSDVGRQNNVKVIEGILYVAVHSGELLRFEARLPNMQMTTIGTQGTFRVEDVETRINIDYRHDHGFTEVGHADVQITGPKFYGQAFLYSLDGKQLSKQQDKGVSIKGNMLNAMSEAGYDSLLWASSEVVKLTERERQTLAASEQREKELAPLTDVTKVKPDVSLSAFSPHYRLAARQAAFGRTIPQEKVFVHMDNTSYQLGDTIWFSAYTRRTDTDRPSDVSGVLYVELYGQEGYLIERKLIQMRKGHGQGFFALNNLIQYAGFYELRAYTRWQLNWGLHEHEHSSLFGKYFDSEQQEREFYRDYDKLYSRVFPVYDRPQEPGDWNHDMTLRAMRRSYRSDPKKRKLKVALYPEGGNLVAGLPCRIAYEATWDDGEWADGWLVWGKDSARVQNRGRGTFTLTPSEGMEQEVRFVTTDGKVVKAKLPQVQPVGISLRMQQGERGWTAHISHTAHLPADSLAVSLMLEGRLLAAHEQEEMEDGEGTCLYSIGDSTVQVPGVYQLTVFDSQGHVYADRLFFSRGNQELKPTLSLTGIKEEYAPYEPVSLRLKSYDGRSNISLSVRDADRSDRLYDDGNILTEMLLASEIRGFVPQPGWYFEQDDEERRRGLDLLMMTQGWRRFDWRNMAVQGAWELCQPAEQAPILTGSTYNNDHWYNPDYGRMEIDPGKDANGTEYAKTDLLNIVNFIPRTHIAQSAHRPEDATPDVIRHKRALDKQEQDSPKRKELKVHAELVLSSENEAATYESASKQGAFRLQLPPFYGQGTLFVSVADTTRWKKGKAYTWIQAQEDDDEVSWMFLPANAKARRKLRVEEATYLARVIWPYPRFVKPYSHYQNHLAPRPAGESGAGMPASPGEHLMQEVTVSAKRGVLRKFNDTWPVLAIDADVAQNMEADLGMDFMQIMVANYGLDDSKNAASRQEGLNEEPTFDLRYGYGKTRRDLLGLSIPGDSIYARKYLMSGSFSLTRRDRTMGIGGFGADAGFTLSPGESQEYMGNGVWDRYVFYSDYSPRMEGSALYYGANMPKTKLVKYPYPDGSRRLTYRDRRYVIDGFAYPAEFYSPDYSQQQPSHPADYRRTLYWNPNVRLNQAGEADIQFYNGSRTARLIMDAQGQAQDGTLLWSR